MRNRFAIRCAIDALLTGPQAILHGPDPIAAEREVMRQLWRDFVAAIAVCRFFAFRDSTMQFGAASDRHPLIQHFVIERMKKPITRRHRAIRPLTRGLSSNE